MAKINLFVNDASATAQIDGKLTAGAVGIPIEVTIKGDRWERLIPKLIAETDGTAYEVVLDGRNGTLPWECLVAGQRLRMGIDGISEYNDIRIPTIWAPCGIVSASVAEASPLNPGPNPTPTVVDQITALAGNANAKATRALEVAEESRDSAKAYAEQAEAAKNTAYEYAEDAGNQAAIAITQAGDAKKSAESAGMAANTAMRNATMSQFSADSANTARFEAVTAKDEATASSLEAAGYAAAARADSEAASASAETAQTASESAAASAASAANSAAEAEQKAEEIGSRIDVVEQLLPEAAPVAGKVLKVLSVIPDGTFTCEWADAPSGGGNVPNDAERIPDNVVLFEQDDSNDDEQLVESLLLNKLALESDGEYIYLKFGGIELGKVESASGASTVYCTGIEINQNDLNLSISDSTTHYLTASVSPVDCTQAIRWSSSNIEAVQVSQLGELTIVGEGVATIVARCGSYSDSIEVAVVDDELHYEIVTGGMILSNGTDAFREARKDRCTLKPLLLYVGYDSTIKITVADSGFYFGVAGWNIPGSTDDLENNGRVTTSGRILDSGWKSGTYTATSTGWTHLGLAFRYGGGSAFTEEAIARLAAALTIEVM